MNKSKLEEQLHEIRKAIFFYLLYNAFAFVLAKTLAFGEKDDIIWFGICMFYWGKTLEDVYLKYYPDDENLPLFRILLLALITLQFIFFVTADMIAKKFYVNDLALYLLFNTILLILLERPVARALEEENK